MQVPEKLTLIGGSILLASTLVFTLKSQASNIPPKVDSGVSSLVHADKSGQSSSDSSQSQQRAQADQAFNNNFQQAQQRGWQTGQWGSAQFYVDTQGNMHVGSGQLSGSFSKVVNAQQIKTISLDEDVQAPQDSHDLLTTASGPDNTLTNINGLNNLNTSQVTSMNEMFGGDSSLSNLDVSHFDTSKVNDMSWAFATGSSSLNHISGIDKLNTSQVQNMTYAFSDNYGLKDLDLSHLNTSNVENMDAIFFNDKSLNDLNVSNLNTAKVNNMAGMFATRSPLLSHINGLKDLDTSNVTDMNGMFNSDTGLKDLDLSHFDNSKVDDMNMIFNSLSSISSITLGNNTYLKHGTDINDGNWKNGSAILYSENMQDDTPHPGTWVKQ